MSMMPRRVSRAPFVWLAAAVTCSTVSAAQQESRSAAVAVELVQALEAAKLDGIAAVDPSTPGGFIAALYMPGMQLLVVSAKYAAPPLLLDKINTHDFRGLYMDLHAAAMPGTRIFIQDLGADGLAWRPLAGHGVDGWD